MENKQLLLIVDDEPNNLQLMRQILSDRYQLAFAINGEQALEAAKKVQPDCILLDIMMPGMDGYETCDHLKKDDRTKDIPVIFVTAKGEIEDETKGLERGAIDYISKPISPPIVRARLKNHLSLKNAREEIKEKNRRLEEQNKELIEAARLREDVERITRHDLKTPLNAIVSFPRFMREDRSLPEKYLEYLKIIEESGYEMLNMINLSLDLFKMERKIYRLCADHIDIVQIIHKILIKSEPIVKIKKLSTDILINGSPAEAHAVYMLPGEKLLCFSMLANLIKNAFEASPQNERITINLFPENHVHVISIHNKGVVPDEIRDRFFEKYATSGKKGGTGLGTYSAKLIANTHGGDIHLDASDENGTTVIVRLPVKTT